MKKKSRNAEKALPLTDDAFVDCTTNPRINQNITIYAENTRALSNSLEKLTKVRDNMQIYILLVCFPSATNMKKNAAKN